ncbi:protein FAM149B1-like isoform X2 [Apostichopus japonicus]|uniref:protein FAM149B1-like isoform X2 n=1 Tax=Stichopus japonicus TaxID=307972 RepID=UPI003AB5B0FF
MLDFVNNSGVLSLEMVGPRSKSCNLMIVGRGISAGSSEQHPLAERQQTSNLPLEYLQSVNNAIGQYTVSPSISEQSSPVEDDDDDEEDTPNNQLMLSNSGWTTGNSTERSSLFSWADDEFDQQAARTVRRMFEEIDSMLYEVAKPINAGSTLQNECKDWKNSFPHLRILGMQLLPPGDEGFEVFPRDPSRPPTTGELLDIGEHELPGSGHESQGLVIHGKHCNAIHSESVVQSRTTGHLVQDEEVIEADGIVEEYLAYDRSWSSEEGHEQKQYHAPRRRRGFPPITPNACRQNSVCSNAFDVLWEEIVGWLRFLVKRQIEEHRFQSSHDSVLPQRSGLHQTAPSFDLGMLSYGPDYTGRNLLDQPVGKLAPMGSGLRFSAGPSLNFNLYDQKSALNGVMTISSKALHNRLGDKERTPLLFGDEGAFPYQRPNSSSFFPKGGRPGSTKFSDLMVHNSRLSSARVGKSRLKPLERAKTPALDSVVTGKKIMAVGDRLVSPPQPLSSSPPRNWSRNATLPPIEQVQESNLTRENLKFPRGSARIRISSAVTADDRRQAPKERIAPFVFDTRPNTTHSFTTDMPMGGITRRCSTPHFQGVQTSKPGTPSAQGAPHFMSGITGVSLGIPGTTSQMETQHYETAPPLSSYLRLL